MMAAFEQYADWYDAFNEQKDYAAEVAYVLGQVEALRPAPKRWLDVGCGTGKHVIQLRRLGIDASGLDSSPEMVSRARLANPDLSFHLGSAQNYGLSGSLDAITMLFHVMSYQIRDEDVEQAVSEARNHLASGAVFAFDFWHTPAVTESPPEHRIREALIQERRLFRITHPTEDKARRRIDVRYEFRWDSADGPCVHEEIHRMRHFAVDEIRAILSRAGLAVRTCTGWMGQHAPGPADWYAMICATSIARP
jgi:SAM-dependent methyltransferase